MPPWGVDHPSPTTFLRRGTPDSSPGMPGPAQTPPPPAGRGLELHHQGFFLFYRKTFQILSWSLAAGEESEHVIGFKAVGHRSVV